MKNLIIGVTLLLSTILVASCTSNRDEGLFLTNVVKHSNL